MKFIKHVVVICISIIACDSTSGPENPEPFPYRLITNVYHLISTPEDVAVSPDGESICVVGHWTDSYMQVIDSSDFSFTDTVYVGLSANTVRYNHAGTDIYVAHVGHMYVSVIDAVTFDITDTFFTDYPADDLVVSPNDEYLYLVHYWSGSVSVIRSSDFGLEAEIDVGPMPIRACITPDGSSLYVGFFRSNSVVVISTESNTVVDSVDVGEWQHDLECEPNGEHVLVTCENGQLALIRTTDNEVAKTLDGVWYGDGICYLPDGSYVYVSGSDYHLVSVIDTDNYEIVGAVEVGTFPRAIAVHPNGDYVYVLRYWLSVIGF